MAECSLCEIDIGEKADTTQLGCGHSFHAHCIAPSLVIFGSHCPDCPTEQPTINFGDDQRPLPPRPIQSIRYVSNFYQKRKNKKTQILSNLGTVKVDIGSIEGLTSEYIQKNITYKEWCSCGQPLTALSNIKMDFKGLIQMGFSGILLTEALSTKKLNQNELLNFRPTLSDLYCLFPSQPFRQIGALGLRSETLEKIGFTAGPARGLGFKTSDQVHYRFTKTEWQALGWEFQFKSTPSDPKKWK